MLSPSSKHSTSHEDDDLMLENSSASVVASNCDLLQQILLRVPMKSLILFKCVSKSWLSLFSDPHFVQSYTLQNHRLSNRGLFLHKFSIGGDVPKFEFLFADGRNFIGSIPFKTPISNELTIMVTEHSCNGLICCSSGSIDDYKNSRTFYIFNPSTSQYRILPRSPSREDGFMVRNASLAFDPLKSHHYQLVCILLKDGYIFQIDIYSSKTASWRRSGEPFSDKPFMHTTSGVFWNGSLHWVHVTREPHLISLKESFVYFDVNRELVMDMPVPQIPDGKSWDEQKIGYFGEYKGHLHLIPNYDTYDANLYIFEMEDIHYKQWNLKYIVNLEELSIAYPRTFFDNYRISEDSEELYEHLYSLKFSILLVQEDEQGGGGESLTILIHIPDKIISYDLKKSSFKETHDLPPSLFHTGPDQTLLCDAHQYIESLACV